MSAAGLLRKIGSGLWLAGKWAVRTLPVHGRRMVDLPVRGKWKLLLGRLRDSWLEYPPARQRMSSVPAGANIFLTGTHRSGTTWLAQMLAASGIWYLHEPYAPLKGRWPQYFSYRPSGARDPDIDEVFEDALAGRFAAASAVPNTDHPLMPLRIFRPKSQRILIKDPLACLLTEYLTRRFKLQTLVLFRHPAGFASSICRLGWPRGEFLRQFLGDEQLMSDHLEPYRGLLEKHVQQDDVASAAVLHGALNVVLWRFVASGVGTALQFEALCRDPLQQLQALFERLQLPYGDQVRDAHRSACHGSPMKIDAYRPHATSRNSMEMADSWRGQLSSAEIGQIRQIWESFDIPLYRDEAQW
jgi:hypothetical protein